MFTHKSVLKTNCLRRRLQKPICLVCDSLPLKAGKEAHIRKEFFGKSRRSFKDTLTERRGFSGGSAEDLLPRQGKSFV